MPIILHNGPDTRYVVVCQAAQRICMQSQLNDVAPMFLGMNRYMLIFIHGNFTLEEANAFAVDSFDQVGISNRDLYFQHSPGIHTVGFSSESVPVDLEYVINDFSTVDFVDPYTFHLLRHITDRWMESGSGTLISDGHS